MATRKDIADLIFPDVKETIADLEKKYPPRANPICSRFAPSPTGFLHIGAVFTAFVAWKFCAQQQGTFVLRIEDTDQKRSVEWAIDEIIDLLKTFNITINEWPIGEDNAYVGNYWPYIQSQRKYFYQVFAKQLIAEGKAYPCRMSEEEIETVRKQQEKTKKTPGIYGNYSVRRSKSPEEIATQLEGDKNFTIRFRSPGDLTKRVVFDDILRGRIDMNDNYNDIVLLKSDGLPTYHLAHVVDDHLMRMSHIIRAEERMPSVPLHLQLFAACWLPAPKYCHVAQILKLDDGKKRKLSKRKDPEANVAYFFENGYAVQWILEYLINLVDSKFEDRQKANPEKSYLDFEIRLEDMNKAWALFDLVKLQSVNNAYLSRISTDELYDQSLVRAKKYRPELAKLMQIDVPYMKAAMNIERHTEKDPKRFTTYTDVEHQLRFFFDDEREKLQKAKPELPEMCASEKMKPFVDEYSKTLDLKMSVEDRFAQLKEIGKKYGFAGNNAEFKEGGYTCPSGRRVGKIGDLAMFLRVQLCCASKTPDLYSVMQVMGKERVVKRLQMM